MASRGYPSDSHTRSGTRRLSDGSSSATSMSTTDGLMTPSTGSSTPGRQPWSAGSEYGSPADGYHTSEEMMSATPSNTLGNLGREPLPAQTGASLPGGASVSYAQQTFDSSPWGPGQGVDARTHPGQARYATPGPGAVGHGSSSSGDDMASSTFVFPPSPPRRPGARSSPAVGEAKPKTKTKKGTKKEKKGREHTRNGSASSELYSQGGSYASDRSFSSAGPYAPTGPHQPYPSSEFDVLAQPYPSAGFDVQTQSYPSTGYNVAIQSHHPTQSYDPVGPNTRGMSDTPGMPYAPDQWHHPTMPYPAGGANNLGMYDNPGASSAQGMFDTTVPWPSSSRSITLAPGASWAGTHTHDDFSRYAFLNPSGLSAPSYYPDAIAEHDCHDYGAPPSQDMDEQEYDMMEDARDVENFENVKDGGRSKHRR